jgi:hypothetical protein
MFFYQILKCSETQEVKYARLYTAGNLYCEALVILTAYVVSIRSQYTAMFLRMLRCAASCEQAIEVKSGERREVENPNQGWVADRTCVDFYSGKCCETKVIIRRNLKHIAAEIFTKNFLLPKLFLKDVHSSKDPYGVLSRASQFRDGRVHEIYFDQILKCPQRQDVEYTHARFSRST